MDKEKMQEFQKELTALLTKYDVSLAIKDVPATKTITIVPNKKEVVLPETTSEVTASE